MTITLNLAQILWFLYGSLTTATVILTYQRRPRYPHGTNAPYDWANEPN